MKFIQFIVFYLLATCALASPGAHGPNGEHLDASGATHVHADGGPRVEAFSESFELVGRLQDGELSILIDRYETNEPVLNGKLEVESNGMKASARFHADHGDYAVDDASFIKAISEPGKHPLMFTLSAGEESDLLEGALEVRAANAEAMLNPGESGADVTDRGFSFTRWATGGVVAAILLLALAILKRRRQSNSRK